MREGECSCVVYIFFVWNISSLQLKNASWLLSCTILDVFIRTADWTWDFEHILLLVLLSDSQRQRRQNLSEVFQLLKVSAVCVSVLSSLNVIPTMSERYLRDIRRQESTVRACLQAINCHDIIFIVREGLIDQIRSLSASADSRDCELHRMELKIKKRASEFLFHGLPTRSRAQVHHRENWKSIKIKCHW